MTTPNTQTPHPQGAGPESQEQRWVKYGANVVLTCVIVVAVASIAVYASQKHKKRTDLTSAALYSLKPQTVNIISGLDKPIKLVSLYQRLKTDEATEKQDFRQPVLDLLEEYKRNSGKIEVLEIDPTNEPAAFDAWLREVKQKYGGNFKAYEEVLKQFPTTLAEIKKLASAEAQRMRDVLKGVDVSKVDEEQANILNATYQTVLGFPAALDTIQQLIDEQTRETERQKGRIRDYKSQMELMRAPMEQFSRRLGAVKKHLADLEKAAKAPQQVKDYAKDAGPRLEGIRKSADDLLAKMKELGELKLDEIRRKLTDTDDSKEIPQAIVVMGPEDLKILEFKDVWKSGETFGMGDPGSQPKLRFSGEQRITSAILSLTQTDKPKVAFVRSGGPPLTNAGMGERSMYAEMAERLRSYNFEVVEKDLSGTWQRQAMMQQMPAPPELSEDEIKKAIWVVLPVAPFSMMGPTPPVAPKVAEHLKSGGSALILVGPQMDNMEAAIKDWGIDARTEYLAVHESIDTAAGASGDIIEQAKRQPFIFVTNEFGDHPVVKSLRSLDAVFLEAVPVQTRSAAGVTVKSILPLPAIPLSWGEKDLQSVGRNRRPNFDAETDMRGPLWLGAAAEKTGAGRLIVIGAPHFAMDGLVNFPDPKMLERQRISVSRFPGNGELFANSIFWLARKDAMMALSPAAMEVSRIEPINPGILRLWRVGVLLVLLPGLVVAIGLWVYFARRD